ncbi:MAG TPA: carbon monoxide dehydrogenase, partial [Clostridiales bacterium]|nr:carbon monoxide dehydrogenase [Clostridiales bacterium]
MKIAVSGKGGTGKTTIAACLASYMASRGARVLAVDADADTSLGLALGLGAEELDAIPPLVELEDLLAKAMGSGAYYPLNPDLEWIPERYSVEVGKIRFLRMGDVKKGGSECYCRENIFLQSLISFLVLSPGQDVILDMGAGIEHLARGTAQAVDLLLIVTEPGLSSLRTAVNCETLARDLGISNIQYIGNKTS